MATAIKEEVFEITQDTTGLSTENDLAAVTADDSLQIIWEYAVPTGFALVFTSEDVLSAYMVSSGSTEAVDATLFMDVVVMDSSRQNVRTIMGVNQYGNVTEFAEVSKLKHMDIVPGEQIIANEGERVCIRGNNKTSAIGVIDASACYFRLTCKRIRHSLF